MTISRHNFNDIAAGNDAKKREAPFSLRLSFAEKAALRDLAGDMPLGAYIKAVLKDAIQNKKKIAPSANPKALGRVLGQLGKSKLSQNVNQLAKAVNVGALPVTPETESELRQACADIAAMRQELMRALKYGGP
ncbi:hypothetical protein [uncultured Tateyamaria sp.]|uniref:hypothetical protein n=1 Tax=uncultured Tateyamaria sp. TaxID=455651 RepID=UPI0026163EF9|nr:hypothetical protein [uncultured Tateyamaria sp.]